MSAQLPRRRREATASTAAPGFLPHYALQLSDAPISSNSKSTKPLGFANQQKSDSGLGCRSCPPFLLARRSFVQLFPMRERGVEAMTLLAQGCFGGQIDGERQQRAGCVARMSDSVSNRGISAFKQILGDKGFHAARMVFSLYMTIRKSPQAGSDGHRDAELTYCSRQGRSRIR